MTDLRFPLTCLPNDLCSIVLKTMDPHEILAYSFTSKKALSLVQSFGLPLRKARIDMSYWPEIHLDFDQITVQFSWDIGGDDEEMTSLDDIPVKVNVSVQNIDDSTVFRRIIKFTTFNWSNQNKSIGEGVRFDISPLRNNFPKLKRVIINFIVMGPDDIQSAQNVLRAFLPYVKHFHLKRVPLQEDFSIQHIRMANLEELEICYYQNPKLDDLLTLNVERCTINANQFSLRDLNRFFKLWKKGSFPRLKFLLIYGNIGTITASDVLLKGLQAIEVEKGEVYAIQNCHGIRARIKLVNILHYGVSVQFKLIYFKLIYF